MKLFFAIILSFIMSCHNDDDNTTTNTGNDNSIETLEITGVTTTGSDNNYTFNVGISSPDTGCDQYADWWEVITEDGNLIYRRVLAHSHVNEQPFVRSGGAVAISPEQVVIIRAHMNNSGYSIKGFKGSISSDFSAFTLEKNFALDLAQVEPLPNNCAF